MQAAHMKSYCVHLLVIFMCIDIWNVIVSVYLKTSKPNTTLDVNGDEIASFMLQESEIWGQQLESAKVLGTESLSLYDESDYIFLLNVIM